MYSNVGLESPRPKPRTEAPPPFGKKPAPAMPDPEEANEPPAMEASEESGSDLLTGMTKPLLDAGMDPAMAKDTLAGIFEALSASLRGGGAPSMDSMAPDAGDMGNAGV